MTDFLSALEAQLVEAHRDRRRRRFALAWRGGAVLVAAAATAVVVVALVVTLATPGKHHAATEPPPARTTAPPPAGHRRTTVAVLNATTVVGVARHAADTLVANGFTEGTVTNDPSDQQRARSSIYYEPRYKEQAQTAAGCLDIGLDQVLPMDASIRVLADRAPILVVIGADRAR